MLVDTERYPMNLIKLEIDKKNSDNKHWLDLKSLLVLLLIIDIVANYHHYYCQLKETE